MEMLPIYKFQAYVYFFLISDNIFLRMLVTKQLVVPTDFYSIEKYRSHGDQKRFIQHILFWVQQK